MFKNQYTVTANGMSDNDDLSIDVSCTIYDDYDREIDQSQVDEDSWYRFSWKYEYCGRYDDLSFDYGYIVDLGVERVLNKVLERIEKHYNGNAKGMYRNYCDFEIN